MGDSESSLRPLLLRILPIAGLAASAILLVDYLHVVPLFCGAGGGCDIVRHSKYAHLLGIPTPFFGVAFFAGFLLLSFVPGRGARRMLPILATGGALAALAFVGLQVFEIQALCKWCLVADTAAVLLCLTALASRGVDIDLPVGTRVGFGLVAAVAVAAPFVMVEVTKPRGEPQVSEGPMPEAIARRQAAGKATVVEFVDFECPFCRALHQDLTEVKKQFGDKVRIVRLQHPLSMHPHARTAARAACCVDEQGLGDPMAELLYSVPPDDLTEEGCGRLVELVGGDVGKWRECMKTDRPDKRIEADEADATAAGVGREAPVFWIGNVKYVGAQPPEILKDGITRALGS